MIDETLLPLLARDGGMLPDIDVIMYRIISEGKVSFQERRTLGNKIIVLDQAINRLFQHQRRRILMIRPDT